MIKVAKGPLAGQSCVLPCMCHGQLLGTLLLSSFPFDEELNS